MVFATVVGLALPACGGPVILSGYGSMQGAAGGIRQGAHAGVDFSATYYGAPALAAADGEVVNVTEYPTGCGIGVLLAHREFERYTVYCHLEKSLVRFGQTVKRGEPIGVIGVTGNAVNRLHVHLELCIYPCPRGHPGGDLTETEDPLAIAMGCFDPRKTYPTDKLVLTYPVVCS